MYSVAPRVGRPGHPRGVAAMQTITRHQAPGSQGGLSYDDLALTTDSCIYKISQGG